jgi:hypothetical protein
LHAKRSKRKLAADAETELKGAFIRQRLEISGPDDITRTPHDSNEITFERAVSDLSEQYLMS